MGTGTGSKGMPGLGLREPLSRVLCRCRFGGRAGRGVLTPVPEGGEGRGSRPGGSVLGPGIPLPCGNTAGVHEPHLPSSGSGDHCRVTHEATVATAGPRHRLCVAPTWHLCRAGEAPSAAAFALLPGAPKGCGSCGHRHRGAARFGEQERVPWPGEQLLRCSSGGEPGKHRPVSAAQQWSSSEALCLLFGLAKEPTCLSPVLAPHPPSATSQIFQQAKESPGYTWPLGTVRGGASGAGEGVELGQSPLDCPPRGVLFVNGSPCARASFGHPLCGSGWQVTWGRGLTQWFGLEGTFKNHLVPTPCRGQGRLPLDQLSQSPVQPGLEPCQGCSAVRGKKGAPCKSVSAALIHSPPEQDHVHQ